MAPAVFAYDSRFVCILGKGISSTSAMRLRTPAVAWCGTIIETSSSPSPLMRRTSRIHSGTAAVAFW